MACAKLIVMLGQACAMYRMLLGGGLVAIFAVLLFSAWSGQSRTFQQAQDKEIARLNHQVDKLKEQNQQLSRALAKVQQEQSALARQNRELRRTIARFKATGKMN